MMVYNTQLKFMFLAFLILFSPFSNGSDFPAGEELARSVYNRPDGINAISYGQMILFDGSSEPRSRSLYTYRTEPQTGDQTSMIRFLSPADISNTGLLTKDRAAKDTDQWIYLPALGKARRIASSRKGGRFVGSDLFYEDLRDRSPDKDQNTTIGEEEIMGVTAWKLKSVPKDPDSSVYGFKISWIHPSTLIPLRIDFYDRSGRQPIKRSVVSRIKNIQGYWTVIDSTMTDLASGHSTRMIVDEIAYDQDIPMDSLSRALLEDPVREQGMRRIIQN